VTKVPLIITGTGRTGRLDHSVGIISLYRTICQLAGIDPDDGVDTPIRGTDLLSNDTDNDVFIERQGQAEEFVKAVREARGEAAAREANRYERALVRGRYKHIREYDPETGEWTTDGELYNYIDTPDELTERDDESCRTELATALDTVVDSLEPRTNTGGVGDLDSDVETRLQELGYIT